MKKIGLFLLIILFQSMVSYGQTKKEKEQYVAEIFKDIQNKQLEKLVHRFVDNQFMEYALELTQEHDPKAADYFKNKDVQEERNKAEQRFRKSVIQAFNTLEKYRSKDRDKIILQNFEMKEAKKDILPVFKVEMKLEISATIAQLIIPRIVYEDKSGSFFILSDKVRFRVLNGESYRTENKEYSSEKAEQNIQKIKEAMDEVAIEIEEEREEYLTPPPPPPSPPVEEAEVFQIVEQMPEFPGGQDKLYQYISRNIRYPEIARDNGIEGRVYISFVVDKDGSIVNAKVLRDIGGNCGKEALRVVNKMPKWKAGIQRGKPVRVLYRLPVMFKLK